MIISQQRYFWYNEWFVDSNLYNSDEQDAHLLTVP